MIEEACRKAENVGVFFLSLLARQVYSVDQVQGQVQDQVQDQAWGLV